MKLAIPARRAVSPSRFHEGSGMRIVRWPEGEAPHKERPPTPKLYAVRMRARRRLKLPK
jgi:hypothetical protein